MTNKLSVAVVGGGVGQGHIQAYRQLPDLYEVTAFCDIDDTKVKTVCDEYDIANSAHKIEELFDLDIDIDIVDICTPSNMHFAQALKTIDAGKNVVIEKPMASSLAEADELIEAGLNSSASVFPVFQYRFGNGIGRLRHLIEKGFAGTPAVVTAETHWFRGDDYYSAGPWRGQWASELGGTLTTHATHIHDLLVNILGPVESVFARADNRINGNETEDRAILSLAFQDGSLATSSVTLGSHQETSRLRFCFTDVTAESCQDPYNPGRDPWLFSHSNPIEQTRIDTVLADYQSTSEGFVGQFERIHAALCGGAEPPVAITDARASLELLTAAYWSIQTGEVVELPISDIHPFYRGWTNNMNKGFSNG
ncbi:MAG: Gfo/Idh/MocA family oxidoreductase [Gammaproteobacteria bacterium]|nr:Gfo/Idh/MocA family oxidoreductase [Gammaproteobacteria bacterium]